MTRWKGDEREVERRGNVEEGVILLAEEEFRRGPGHPDITQMQQGDDWENEPSPDILECGHTHT